MDRGAKVGLYLAHELIGCLPVARTNRANQALKIGFHVRFGPSRAYLEKSASINDQHLTVKNPDYHEKTVGVKSLIGSPGKPDENGDGAP
jgi:hypothetical protein